MTLLRFRNPLRVAGVVTFTIVLVVTGCSSKKAPTTSKGTSGSSTASSPVSSGSSSDNLNAMLPASIKSSGVIKIATDASYAPNEFFAADGKTIIGMDVDLGNAIATKLGVKAEFKNVTFDAIIAALAGGKYDLGMSSFTDTKEREKTVNFVTYFSAGESLIVAAGNPRHVTGPDLSLCGLTIAVEKGTTEESEIPALSKKCTDAGKPSIKALSTDDQNQANLAVRSGRAEVGSADSPVAEYAVKQSNGGFALAGASYENAPYGIAVPKNTGDFAKAIQTALQELIADGTYKKILDKWGIGAGAITTPAINAAVS